MINRRKLVQSAPFAALAAGAVIQTETPDPHASWIAEHKALIQRMYAPDTPDVEMSNPDWIRSQELEELISVTPAKTPKGAAAQLEFALSEEANFDLIGGIFKDLDAQALRNVLTTLQSLA
ncbi:hypothetical protein OU790_18120 [Ruegeria sp. NA]|nr:hypothetical protein [Ruegeria sp. NA]MCX8955343.1 hypothetical protein [Ruegeria sp. NA]